MRNPEPVRHASLLRPSCCLLRNWPGGQIARMLFLAAIFVVGRTMGREVDPREFGFALRPGAASFPVDQRVVIHNGSDVSVIARTYANIGDDQRIVLLPDGQLVGRTVAESPVTEQVFEPATLELLCRELSSGPFRDLRSKKTKHYLCFYNSSENFVLVASRILETMIPGMMNHARPLKIAVHEPEFPLVAVMFRSEAQFQQFRRMPAGVVAYYDVASNYIVMYEESDLWRVKPELAIQESISTIAHEGAHQILHNIGVQQRLSRWPMWISEGLAEYYAPTSFGKSLRWKGAGQVNDMRMFNLELFLKGRGADAPSGQMIEHTVMAARLTSTGYASAWSLTHYLARSYKDDFQAYLREVSRLGPFEGSIDVVAPGIVPENGKRFKQHFGGDLAKLEAGLVKHLKALPYTDPFAEWPHYVATAEITTGRRLRREANLFHSQSMARKWIAEYVESIPAEQRNSVQCNVHAFRNRGLAEVAARQFLGTSR